MINFSELMWKPEKGQDTHRSAAPTTEELPVASEFSEFPSVTVDIEPESRIVVFTEPGGVGADRFRLLRMRLRELRGATDLRTILISSPLPEDGKSTVALNLATALAEGGRRPTLLVEADLHQPSIARTLKLPRVPGLAECIESGLNPLSVLRRIEPLGWYLMESGTPHRGPSSLLQEETFERVILELRNYFEWIVIDTPPLAALTDAVSVSRCVDTSLLVLRAGRTRQAAAQEAMRLLGPSHVLGVILNGDEETTNTYRRYAGYYAR
jgi:receptor protein-tyrosine kinase